MKAVILSAVVAVAYPSDVSARPICGGALVGWRTPPALIPEFLPTVSITLAASGDVQWNGVPVTRPRLRSMLIEAKRESSPHVFAIFGPAPDADCGLVDQVRREMARYLDCPAQCGEGNLKYF